ncbi:hypothetical protein CQA53_02970 [Helicobacter didelphidarum]|uniref:Haem-binding uptake Tiki superfamily ChaN domain-containing protein n=1 Tax=Helicobacter didelphidarum TaxID=2040648 RepID=A0A3D8ING6_9HELI|nr:hypothetical protein CQA53_02970 [Helicobacter didelphidarum]
MKPFVIANKQDTFNFDEFIKQIIQYDIVIIGEEHDNMQQYLTQAKIIQALAEQKILILHLK